MPNLEFKGKQIVYAHHMTIPYRPLVPAPDKSLNPPELAEGQEPQRCRSLPRPNFHVISSLTPGLF